MLMMESLLFLVIFFCMDCTTCLCVLNLHLLSTICRTALFILHGPVNGFRIINFDLFNSEHGTGVAQWVFHVTIVGNNKVHFTIRNLLTFSGGALDSQLTSKANFGHSYYVCG